MQRRFIKTTMGTDFYQKESLLIRIIKIVLFFVPKTNPGYEGKLHLVKLWLIEFDKKDQPTREIGIDKDGEFVIAGPNERDYGYWLDTSMKYGDFTGVPVPKNIFEDFWMKR